MLNLQKNYLQKYPQIYQQSSDWNSIEYKLQLNLGNASAYIKRVFNVTNPHQFKSFENQNKGSIISEIYIKPQDLQGSNRIERVCQKGFQIPNKTGMQFTLGQVNINPKEKEEHELLVVKICPRRSYPVYEKDFNYQLQGCPDGFDSILYKQQNEEDEIYQHKFRLYKKMQILPCYVIHFSFNQQHQNQFKEIICEKCQDQIAIIYCSTEKVFFCKNCDYGHHKDKISAKHQRSLLSQNPILDFGTCRNHKGNKNQLFCKTCNAALCMSCKIYGDHSEGNMASHELSKISDYYVSSIKKIEEMDPNLEKRKYHLHQLLNYLDDEIMEVNQMTKKLQKQLKDLFCQHLNEIQNISKRKLSYLMSDQLQARRQYDYIQWMESFLKYERHVLPPNDYIMAWTKHEKLRKDVLNVSNIPAITQIVLNMEIVGQIEVIDKEEEYNNIEHNPLQKKKKAREKKNNEFEKESGQNQNNSDFRKKLLFQNVPT